MVRGLIEPADDLRVHAGIQRSVGDDLLEESRIDPAGAGKGHQHTPGPQQLEPQQVDILVAAGGFLRLGGRGSKLGRVEDDQVILLASVPQRAQLLEDVPGDPFAFLRWQVVQGDVLAGQL